MFSNPNIQSNITQLNGTSFDALMGFGMYSSANATYYYVMDYWANKVFILNDEWSFISSKVFNYPAYMINIGNSLYMTGNYNVCKVDKDLNILRNYNPGGTPSYRGISYSPSNGFIYVALENSNSNEIQIFNLDLTLIRRFSTSPYGPWSITISSNQLYAGERIILVYQNEILIRQQFNGCNGNSDLLTSIFFDPNGHLATTCLYSNKLYLFSPDGSFTGKSISTPQYPHFIGFDSKGRFIQISAYQIIIYN